MTMQKIEVGLIGWRGMVGTVLLERMQGRGDFEFLQPRFFSTSQAGQATPTQLPGAAQAPQLLDAFDLDALSQCQVILSCQGGDYTNKVHDPLREKGWQGYWIDAASALRMREDTMIMLDPVNAPQLQSALKQGIRSFAGGNCTVSLMLLAIWGLLQKDEVEWVSSMSYQAASGAGAQHMRELLQQMHDLGKIAAHAAPQASILDLDREVHTRLQAADFPQERWGGPLAGNLIPWIDRAVEAGRSREEWKAQVESNKILGLPPATLPVDGTCVRIGAMRSHAQGLTIKLKKDIPLADVETLIRNAHPWLDWVNNDPESTRRQLSPAAVSGTLKIAVGRVRKMSMGPQYLNLFTVGDQLLWGAAEPLRRMLRIVINEISAPSAPIEINS